MMIGVKIRFVRQSLGREQARRRREDVAVPRAGVAEKIGGRRSH